MEPLWKIFTKQQIHALNTSASSNPKILFNVEPEEHKCKTKSFEVRVRGGFLIQFTFCTRRVARFSPASKLLHHIVSEKRYQHTQIMSFTGTLRVKICEASGLKPTDYQKRFELNFGKSNDKKDLDPYVSLNVDEKFIGE